MGKMRVMHILCTSSYSGAENVAITLINSLADKVDSVYVSPDGSIREIVEQNGIKHYAVNKISISNIKKAIKDIKPQIIHAHDFTAGIICAVASGSIPVINHLHNNSPWLKSIGIKSLVYGLSCFRYKAILTVSNSVMKEYIFGNTFKEKTFVIGNPVNLSVIRSKADDTSQDGMYLTDASDIVFLGRLTLPKNPLVFLEIINDLRNKKPNLRVCVVGDGELRGEFEKKIKEYGLSDCISMHGFQNNPYTFLKAAKVMCMPSLWEGFGLAAVEALAFGKPVVAAPVGGLVEIINNSCGRLCLDKDEYVSELYRLLTDAEYYEQKSDGAFKRAEDFDNIEQYSDIIWNVYRKATGVK